MSLTTLGNVLRQLRVANERLTPAIRRGSLAVSSAPSDWKPPHLATGVRSVAVNGKPDVVKFVGVTSPPYSVSVTRRRRNPIALALAAVSTADHEMHGRTGYSFVCVLCRY